MTAFPHTHRRPRAKAQPNSAIAQNRNIDPRKLRPNFTHKPNQPLHNLYSNSNNSKLRNPNSNNNQSGPYSNPEFGSAILPQNKRFFGQKRQSKLKKNFGGNSRSDVKNGVGAAINTRTRNNFQGNMNSKKQNDFQLNLQKTGLNGNSARSRTSIASQNVPGKLQNYKKNPLKRKPFHRQTEHVGNHRRKTSVQIRTPRFSENPSDFTGLLTFTNKL